VELVCFFVIVYVTKSKSKVPAEDTVRLRLFPVLRLREKKLEKGEIGAARLLITVRKILKKPALVLCN
jgi:hypothetical protein